jgi:hypothetical protein
MNGVFLEGVTTPAIWAHCAGGRAIGQPAPWRGRLPAPNAAVMAIVFAAPGVLLIGKSIGGLGE